MAAKLQDNTVEAGVVAALRTEAQRTAGPRQRCAELCRQSGPEAETSLLHADSLCSE